MARIYLHIGTHKTGTTSIQYYLNYRKEELLAQGILAPAAGKIPDSDFSGNHRLAWSIDHRHGELSGQTWEQLAVEMDRFVPAKVVISSEAFSHLKNDQAGQVKKLLDGHETFIIIYFRSYKAYLRSVYAQVVRDKEETRSFRAYVSSRPELVDYNKILRIWGEHFGYDHLLINIYDDIVSNSKLLPDFCQTIGFIPHQNDSRFMINRNITPEEKDINAMRLINLCKVKFPYLLNDRTVKNLKEAIYSQQNRYVREKIIFRLLAKNRCCTKKSDLLISELVENSDQELLKEMIGEDHMEMLAK